MCSPSALPFRVGRSRNQALVIDWAHADVSGQHFDIVALDESGATIVVHGDNGVVGRRNRARPGDAIPVDAGGDARPRQRRGAGIVVRADAVARVVSAGDNPERQRPMNPAPSRDRPTPRHARRGDIASFVRERAYSRGRVRLDAAVASSRGSFHAVNEDGHSALDGSVAAVRRRRRRQPRARWLRAPAASW